MPGESFVARCLHAPDAIETSRHGPSVVCIVSFVVGNGRGLRSFVPMSKAGYMGPHIEQMP